MKAFLTVLLILLSLAVGWIARGRATPPPEESPPPAPAEETPGRVRLDPEQARLADLQVEVVRLSAVQGGLEATGVLAEDPDRKVRVTSRLPGKIVSLAAGVGDTVRSGQPLVTLEGPDLPRLKSEYHEARTAATLARQSYERRLAMARYSDDVRRPLEEAQGEMAAAEGELAVAESTLAVALRQYERYLELQKDGITSQAQIDQARGEVVQARARRDQAATRLQLARTHLKREQNVRSKSLLVSKELQESSAAVTQAEERALHLREQLESLGVDPDSHDSSLTLTAPLSGIVVSRPVTRGEAVDPEDELFTLVDPSRLWLWVDVYESTLSRLAVGQAADVRVAAYPRQVFHGQVSYIDPGLNPETRAGRARVVIDNHSRLLKPAMFASVVLRQAGAQQGILVPEPAVEDFDGVPSVYVAVGGDEFERRPVRLGVRQAGKVEVVEGLSPGDRLVTAGAFVLKSVEKRDEIGGED